ncbi:unnamed protein product, partial [Rotaria socialis]
NVNFLEIINMSDFDYQSYSDLESDESSPKGINRYKKNTRYGRRRSRRLFLRRSRTLSVSESNTSAQGSQSRSTSRSRSRTRSEGAVESRTSMKIAESLKRASVYVSSPKSAQIFEINRLQEQLAAAHLCSEAHFIFIVDINTPQGLYHENGLKCSVCEKVSIFTNFEPMPLHKIQEPNQRLYVANALTGIGYDNLSLVMATLCLKIPNKTNFVPQVLQTYDNLNIFIHKHFISVIGKIRSLHNVETNDSDSIVNIAISVDGTWKKRGHVSQYGIVFIIEMDTGLAIDFEVLSTRFEKCEKNQRERSAHEFRAWLTKHKGSCECNWDGTAKGMEKEGTKRLFERSIKKEMQIDIEDEKKEYNEKRSKSKDFEVDYLVIKEDCINHVQKRVSSRLKDIRAKYSHMEATQQITSKSSMKHHQLLSDSKPYSGSLGRMTREMEQKFTSLYGNAIREIFLVIFNDMIEALTNKDLLRRCLRGVTQNSNECLNSIIWSILSKTKNHGYRSIRGAAALACIYFNQGRSGLLEFFKDIDIDVNDEQINTILGKDQERLRKSIVATQKQNDIRERKKQTRFESTAAEVDMSEYGGGRH